MPELTSQGQLRDKLAFWFIVATNVLIVTVASYFAYVTDAQNETLANQAIAATEANRALIQTVGEELGIHGRASADRSCATMQGVQYLIRQSPELDPKVDRRFDEFVDRACVFQDPAQRQQNRASA